MKNLTVIFLLLLFGNFPGIISGNNDNHAITDYSIMDCDNDEVPPVAICDIELIIETNAQEYTVYAFQLDDGSYDDCGGDSLITYSLSPDPSEDSIIIDTQNPPASLTLWITDAAGNQNSCITSLTITSCPSITCNAEINVEINNTNSYLFYTTDILEGNLCNGAIYEFEEYPGQNYIDLSGFESGEYIFTVIDILSGNSCWSNVTITNNCINDTTDPIAVCEEFVYVYTIEGPQNIWAYELDDGSYDECSTFLNYSTSSDTSDHTINIDPANAPPFVSLWVTDMAGNQNSCMVEVIVDVCPPLVCITEMTILLDPDESNFFYPSELILGNPCPSGDYKFEEYPGLDVIDLDVLGPGSHELTLLNLNQTQECSGVINLIEYSDTLCSPDTVGPIPYCFNELYFQTSAPNITIYASDLDAGSYDACSGDSLITLSLESETVVSSIEVSTTSPPSSLTLYITDEIGNQSYCIVALVIESCPSMACNDMIPIEITNNQPYLFYPTDMLEGSLCSGAIYEFVDYPGQQNVDLSTFETGDYIFSVIDITSGNQCWGTVNITNNSTNCDQDEVAPIPYCYNDIVIETSAPEFTFYTSDLDAGSYDNCTPDSLLILSFYADSVVTSVEIDTESPPDFLSLFVTDQEGNQDYCNATINIESCPGMACNDMIPIEIVNNEPYLFYPTDMLEGSLCNGAEYEFDGYPGQDFVDLSQFPEGESILSVIDILSGNQCWGTIIVSFPCSNDTTPPVAVCHGGLNLMNDLPVTVWASDLDNGSFDLCTGIFLSLSSDTSVVSVLIEDTNIPDYLELWVTDEDGNQNSCLVSISNNCSAIACNDSLLVTIDTLGEYLFYPEDMLEGPCTNSTYSFQDYPDQDYLDLSTFETGTYLMIIVDDDTGNSCWGELFMDNQLDDCNPDEVAPVAICEETLTLTGDGEVIVNVSQLDDGSFDSCSSSLNYSFTGTEGDTSLILDLNGDLPPFLSLYVFDDNGNSNSCSTTLIVAQDSTDTNGVDMQVFPNPITSQEILTVRLIKPSETAQLNLFDSFGKKIQQKNFIDNEAEIPLYNFNKGIYFIYVVDNEEFIASERVFIF